MNETELQTRPPGGTVAVGVHALRVDVVETEDDPLLYADLRGVKAGDVKLNFTGDELILHARCAPRHHGRAAIHAEYAVAGFCRAFDLTGQVDCSGIEASAKGRMFAVRLLKAEHAWPKRIVVRGG